MIRNRPSCLTLAILSGVVAGFSASPARAQLSAWLDFEGAIKGESVNAAHKDWIDILGFGIGSSREVSTFEGGGREGSLPSISEFSLTKQVDRATPKLFSAATVGNSPYPKATLDLTHEDGVVFARLELENVLVSGQSFSASTGSDRPLEEVSLNFERITFIYLTPGGGKNSSTYDLATGRTSNDEVAPNPDRDSDGMLDDWETFYGLAVGTNDANADADGDGLSNLHEYQLGTHPKSGTSFFRASLAPDAANPGNYQLTWNSVSGKTYVVEWSPNLVTPFAAVRTVTASSANSSSSFPITGSVGFYRVRPQ